MGGINWKSWILLIATIAVAAYFISEKDILSYFEDPTPVQENINTEEAKEPSKEELKKELCFSNEPFSAKGSEFLYGAGSTTIRGMVEIRKSSIWNKRIPVVFIKTLSADKEFKRVFSTWDSNIERNGEFILFPLGKFENDDLVTTASISSQTRKGIIQALDSRRQIGLKLTFLSAQSSIKHHERVIAPHDTPACRIDWVEIPR